VKQEKIWEYFQGSGVSAFAGSGGRLTYLVRKAARLTGDQRIRVLNIGVGNGSLERQCLARRWETCALDPSERAIEALAAEGIDAKAGSIDEIPFPTGWFDVVFCSEVMEHLSDGILRAGLQEIRRVLKEDGVLLGTVPYKEDLENNIAVCPECGKIFHRWGHLRRFDRTVLREEMGRAGWEVEAMRTRSFLDLSGLTIMGKARASLHLVLGRMGVAIASPTLYFQARKCQFFSPISVPSDGDPLSPSL
jgi:SAM-dependent methyltransferase